LHVVQPFRASLSSSAEDAMKKEDALKGWTTNEEFGLVFLRRRRKTP
jgi:hypothetical protein